VQIHSLRLDEDLHVHSTFSDGVDTLERNLAAAAELGLKRLGCVDHVRRDTTYVPKYVDAVRRLQRTTPIELSAGIEAKILDASGTLDLPPDVSGVDFVYIADHQFPDDSGPVSPRVIKEAMATGELTGVEVTEQLVDATIASLLRYARRHRLVLAHLFSILPKLGLEDRAVTDEAIERLLAAARLTETTIEVSERWRCPGEHVVRMAMRHGVRVVASTDSHRATDIGRYTFVAEMSTNLDAAIHATA
jgi:putative hydrolase